ncbi:YybH family protein [Gillisia marina]|uniref:YybH family protein n=1 Tax=Gillisia marina TaxID=1167637 RepID=UPI00029B4A8C|nr:DUF4440 domain-containing protein [Gillisia marina]
MKSSIFFRVLFALCILLLWNCQQPNENKEISSSEDPKDVRKIIDKKNDQLEIWLKEGNIDSAATIFAENVIQMPPHQEPMEGMNQFKKSWKENVGYGNWDFKIEAQEVKVCGAIAVERGEYVLNFSPNENAPMPAFKDEGNYVVLWENIDGDWKIVWDAPVSKTPMPNSMPEEKVEEVKVTNSGERSSRIRTRNSTSSSEANALKR